MDWFAVFCRIVRNDLKTGPHFRMARQATTMATPNAVDAAFYKQVHRLVSKRLEAGDGDRDKQRRGARCVQRIAPCLDGQMPEMAEFQEVDCQDLSAGGFSYLWPEPHRPKPWPSNWAWRRC